MSAAPIFPSEIFQYCWRPPVLCTYTIQFYTYLELVIIPLHLYVEHNVSQICNLKTQPISERFKNHFNEIVVCKTSSSNIKSKVHTVLYCIYMAYKLIVYMECITLCRFATSKHCKPNLQSQLQAATVYYIHIQIETC